MKLIIEGDSIITKELTEGRFEVIVSQSANDGSADPKIDSLPLDIFQALGMVERRLIERANGETGGNLSHMAKLLGITREMLRWRAAKYKMADEIEDLRLEKARFEKALADADNNGAIAAKTLGIEELDLRRKLRRLGIPRPSF